MNSGDRLKKAIEAAGYKKLSDFAEVAGVNQVTLRQQINRNSIPKDAAPLYVRKLRRVGLTLEYLLYGRGAAPGALDERSIKPIEPRLAGASVPVTHFVGAGDRVYPIEGDSHLGTIPSPPGFADGGAVAIRGDSGRPLFNDQDVLFYKEWEGPPAPRNIPHRPVILELGDGRSYLKYVMPGSKTNRFHLTSINPTNLPIFDVEVVQMARIGWAYFGGLIDVEHAD